MSLRVALLLVLALLVSGASVYFLFFQAATVSKSHSDTIVVKVPDQPVDSIPEPDDYRNALIIRAAEVVLRQHGEDTVIPLDSAISLLPGKLAAFPDPALNVILEKGGSRQRAQEIMAGLGSSGVSKFQWFNLN